MSAVSADDSSDVPGGGTTAGLVFISHSARNFEAAMRIVGALEGAGVPCWIAPRNIPAGAEYNAAIMDGIAASRAVLFLSSKDSVASDPVTREIERAVSRKVPVIPVRLERAELSPALEFLVSTFQWVDAYPPPVDRHLESIVAAVVRRLEGREIERAAVDPAALPKYVGPFRILERLGEGGMGTVYKAEQREPIRRTVALKVIKPGLDTREVLARFESERQALARMDHPHVARVVEAGADDRGRPWFAMEYVPGVPVTRFADEQKLTVRQRLELFVQVCDAITHAHTKALIHRDVKASNVLAFLQDGRPVVKVIDFGIAKALTGDRLTDRTFNTDRGLVLGTYDAMSPEQAAGSADVDTRTDVYSLGVLLYELLAGAKPFDDDTFRQAADDEIRRIIREVEPPKPSTRISSLGDRSGPTATDRRTQPEALARELRTELEWIPLMAMRKERDRRYASPQALATDIQNYLEGRPLQAGPESLAYRTRKTFKRHRAAILGTAALVTLLATGIGLYIRDVRAAEHRTSLALDDVRDEQRKTQAALELAENNRLEAVANAQDAVESAERAVENEKQAQASAREAVRQRMAALQAKRLAEQNAAAAREQSELALQTLRSVIFGLQSSLANVPGGTAVRRKLLETAMTQLEKLSTQFSTRSSVDRHSMVAMSEMGEVLMRLGSSAPGEEAADDEKGEGKGSALEMARRLFERAREIGVALVAANPGSWEAKRDLSVSYERLGNARLQAGQLKDAFENFRQAMDIRKELAGADSLKLPIESEFSFSEDILRESDFQVNQTDVTLRSYNQALESAGELSNADARDKQAQRDLSISLVKLGDMSLRAGMLLAAHEFYLQSLEIRRRLVAIEPENAQALRDVSTSYVNLGDVGLQAGRVEESLTFYRQALEARERLASDQPSSVQAQRDLAVSLNKLGDANLREGRNQEALRFYGRGGEISQKLASADPYDARAQRDLSISLGRLGQLSLRTQQIEIAMRSYQAEHKIRLKLASADPNDAQAQRDLMISLYDVGRTHMAADRYDDAAESFGQGITVLDALIRAGRVVESSKKEKTRLEGEMLQARSFSLAIADWEVLESKAPTDLTLLLPIRFSLLARKGKLTEVAQAAAKLRELEPKTKETQYDAARGYGLCAGLVAKGKKELTDEEKAERTKYADLALACLKDALAAGYDDLKHMKADTDLDALRELPAFQELLKSLEKPE